MRHVAFLVSILYSMCAVSTPVNSMLGAAGSETQEDNAMPTAMDYIHDGLIVLLDGIENSAYGCHNAISGDNARWKNLVEHNIKYFLPGWSGGLNFYDDYVSVIGTDVNSLYGGYVPNYESNMGSYGTSRYVPCEHIEVVFSLQDVENFHTLFSGGWYQNGIRIGCGYIGTGNNTGYEILPNEIVCLSFHAASNSNIYYKNGNYSPIFQEVVSKVIGGTNNYTLLAGGYKWTVDCKFYSLRFYNRVLSPQEVLYNYKIDKLRFGL